ncbi:3-oxoacyl-ACP reductase [Pseudomonas putida]|nr:3-oxoacyl-ACP reductase [Pseudomonas putida]
MKPLQNRRAVITGAGSGIGAAIAHAYADAGALLVLCDRDPQRLALVANQSGKRCDARPVAGTLASPQPNGIDRVGEHGRAGR